MSNTVIVIDNISKKYQLGTIGYGSLRHDWQSWWARLRGKDDPNARLDKKNIVHNQEMWALRDIFLEVTAGDRLGIIGRNGAGKSTLLKILSRITAPTTGVAKIKGRLASLLEVGTGFHPELTGRENIFINGAILGMKRQEIQKKLDAIIAFAEIEQFIDTPVKRYSSGMYVRLAFAVAAHLDAEILIIDEVLAVGDTLFQRKCIDKMTEIGQQGRTILFVSHNLAALKALCTRAILLQGGKMAAQGETSQIIEMYTTENALCANEVDMLQIPRTRGARELVCSKIRFTDYPLSFGQNIKFSIQLQSNKPAPFLDLEIGIAVHDKNSSYLIHCSNRFLNLRLDHSADDQRYDFDIENILRPGKYYLTIFLKSQETIQDWLTNCVAFEIEDGNPYHYLNTNQISGMILPRFLISRRSA